MTYLLNKDIFNRPRVSVILASYNHAPFIKEAVESVLNQTCKDLELIVLDDGSSDGTPEIVAKIKDKRLKLIKLTPNRRFHPRNIGIKMARGKYIAFQNSDDVWLKDKLEKQVDYLENNRKAVVCFTRLNMIDEKGKIIKKIWAHGNLAGKNMNNDAWLRQLFLQGVNFGIASAVVRKDKILKLNGFCENMVQLSDYDLWTRLLGLGQLHIIDEHLTEMRIVKGVNFSSPKNEVYFRSALENVEILNRFTQWPINQFLDNIFPDIMPQNNKSMNIKFVALSKFAWSLRTPHHALFADQLIAKLLNNPKSSNEILKYYGAGLKKEFIYRRGNLQVVIHPLTKKKGNFDKWFANLIKKSSFKLKWIQLSESQSWALKEGKISHKSGKFFDIIGLRFQDNKGRSIDQPFINQREIGTLGFLLREKYQNKEILVQAKIEPGNSHIIQIAPTCQATKSNSLQIHGGKKPPFSHMFTKEHPLLIASTFQSEQGSRFYRKLNRNITALTNDEIIIPNSHRWIPMDTMLNLLSKDYCVNTDARSVLVCSYWNKLVNRRPFSRFDTELALELKRSYNLEKETSEFNKMKNQLTEMQKKNFLKKVIPLTVMNGWKVNADCVEPIQKSPFRIRYLKVIAKNREVPQWDQPIIDSYGKGKVDLICGRIKGELHFLFKPITEPGLYNHTELTPAICIEPGEKIKNSPFDKGKIVLSVNQSDEGGRFFKDISTYRLIDIGQAEEAKESYWLNLAQIQELTSKEGWFTNEARSVISLLLYWL